MSPSSRWAPIRASSSGPKAVKKANSVDRMKVIEALETGISIDAPSGKVTIDPPTHHCILDVHIAEVQDKKLVCWRVSRNRSPRIRPRCAIS